MLISSKLLNIHKSVKWEKEFGLTVSDLNTLIFSLSKQIMKGVNATGAFVCLFEGRDPVEFQFGDVSNNASVFSELRALVNVQLGRHLVTKEENNHLLTKLDKSVHNIDVNACLMVDIFARKEGIKGFACFFGQKMEKESALLESLSTLFVDCCIQSLLAKKYQRLNNDSEEFYELLADTNQHPIFAKDEQSKIVFANQAFIELYPVSKRDKIIDFTTVEDYPEEQRELFLKDDKEAFLKGQKVVVEKIDFPNGEQRTLETTKRRFKTNTGESFILGISYNLTHQYKLIELLKNKNRDLDYIANLLVTDIRVPANALVKLVKWLEEDLITLDNADVNNTISEIKQRTIRLNKLLSAVHLYCFAGRDKHIKSSLSLTDIVSDILSSLKSTKKISTNIDDENVVLPRISLTSVLKELIRNTVDFSKNNTVDIGITCKQDKNNYYLSVIDDGIGIKPEYTNKSFELFETTKSVQSHDVYGVGLAVAKKTIESYEGTLKIDPNYNEGTKIDIIWPKQD